MSLYTWLRRWIRFNYLKILRLKTSAHSIGMGVAVGVFVGFLPIIPFQMVSTIVLCIPLRGNKIAAIFSTYFSNPVTLPFFYALLYIIGRVFTPFTATGGHEHMTFHELMVFFGTAFDPEHFNFRELVEMSWRLFVTMMIGGLLMGIPVSIGSYFLARSGILAYRKRRALRLLKKRNTDNSASRFERNTIE